MAKREARPVLLQSDIEFITSAFMIPKTYAPTVTMEEIRRFEGMKEVIDLLERKFLCQS